MQMFVMHLSSQRQCSIYCEHDYENVRCTTFPSLDMTMISLQQRPYQRTLWLQSSPTSTSNP